MEEGAALASALMIIYMVGVIFYFLECLEQISEPFVRKHFVAGWIMGERDSARREGERSAEARCQCGHLAEAHGPLTPGWPIVEARA